MKRSPFYLIILILQLITVGICRAQTAPVQFNLKPPPANIVIDGDIKEWGDSLAFYSPEERINYMMSNSKDTLYLAVKVYDRTEMSRILNAGLTFSIDPKGKKKETYSITFPLNVGSNTQLIFNHSANADEDVITQADRDELMRERITSLRGIKVVGFKDVEDEMITTSNTYGFQTAVDFDAAGNLILEAAIPLKYLHADDALKNLWAFNIKINGIQRPAPSGDASSGGGGRGGGMGGGGGGRHGGGGKHGGGGASTADKGETSKTIDFWGKFYLAK